MRNDLKVATQQVGFHGTMETLGIPKSSIQHSHLLPFSFGEIAGHLGPIINLQNAGGLRSPMSR
jgi:hypothetical protein